MTAPEEGKKDEKEENMKDEKPIEIWICDRNSKNDVIDKLIHHAHHLDILKIILSAPPTYPITDPSGQVSSIQSLNLNDIHARFTLVAKHGADTNDPCRILTPADFLCSTRLLHTELLRQTTKIRNTTREGKPRSFRMPTNHNKGKYPFSLDVALARLPVRFFVRNYGVPPEFRRTVTAQLLDRTFIHEGEICLDQRVLTVGVKNSRSSVESLLKHPHLRVQGKTRGISKQPS